MQFSLVRIGLLLALLAGAVAHADPTAELGKFSAFTQVDLGKLAGGKVVSTRGPTLDSPRDLSIQALYLVPASLAKTVELHKQWDATRHPELKVFLHGDFAGKPAANDFAKLNSAPKNGSVKALVAATQQLPEHKGLQLSNAEAKAFAKDDSRAAGAMPATVSAFWSHLLLQRAAGFASGGLGSQPAYDLGTASATPAAEVARLLKEQPKIRAQFKPLLDATPLGGGGAAPSGHYWELFDVEGEGALSLGATYAKDFGDHAQMADVQYYSSGGYLVFLTLYEMWPMDGNSTLVWRGDSISSVALGELRGVERMGSGAAMMKEVQRMISLFQKDAR